MTPIQVPITGNKTENDDEIFNALNHFYTAFNNKDFALMEENWLHSSEIAMDNPLGGITRGWEEIKAVYQRIFTGSADVYVEFYDYHIIALENGFCAVGRERGTVQVSGTTLELAIRTSRVYTKIQGKYKQVHHHGSIQTPTLLSAYQNLVK